MICLEGEPPGKPRLTVERNGSAGASPSSSLRQGCMRHESVGDIRELGIDFRKEMRFSVGN
jgi:hypothetical protein